MASAKSKALARVAALGAEIDYALVEGRYLDANVDAPPGQVWAATGTHCVVVHFMALDDAPPVSQQWLAVLDDLADGTRPCTTSDCDYCQE